MHLLVIFMLFLSKILSNLSKLNNSKFNNILPMFVLILTGQGGLNHMILHFLCFLSILPLVVLYTSTCILVYYMLHTCIYQVLFESTFFQSIVLRWYCFFECFFIARIIPKTFCRRISAIVPLFLVGGLNSHWYRQVGDPVFCMARKYFWAN